MSESVLVMAIGTVSYLKRHLRDSSRVGHITVGDRFLQVYQTHNTLGVKIAVGDIEMFSIDLYTLIKKHLF
jgi:hypothetical protein